MSIHVTKAITDNWILPTTSMGSANNQIAVQGCPGQYVPASFTVHAQTAVSILPVPTSIGPVTAADVDIKIVKCWWQAKTISHTTRQWMKRNITDRELTPELLLNDPSFLQTQGQDNLLKYADGSYHSISVSSIGAGVSAPSVAAMPIDDGDHLAAVRIPAGQNQQFWVTFHIPEDAPGGTYSGQISLGSEGTIQVQLIVLPFALEANPLQHVFFTFMQPGSSGTIGTVLKTSEQVSAELEILARHGATASLDCRSDSQIRLMLSKLRQYGAAGTSLQYTGLSYLLDVANSDPARLASLKTQVRRVRALAAEYGFTTVYFHGIDEASAARIAAQKPNFDAVHEAGGKVYVNGYTGVFEAAHAIGDPIDLIYWPTQPSTSEVAKWHRVGAKIGMYGDPHSGVALPLTFRRNYGLRMWQLGLDGAQIFWGWNSGGMIWNDFCDATYVQECMVYPTVDGAVETTELQGDREAIYDLRYMATLQKAISQAPSGSARTAAEAFVTQLRSAKLYNLDLDDTRAAMAQHIMALGGLSPSPEIKVSSMGLFAALLIGLAAISDQQ